MPRRRTTIRTSKIKKKTSVAKAAKKEATKEEDPVSADESDKPIDMDSDQGEENDSGSDSDTGVPASQLPVDDSGSDHDDDDSGESGDEAGDTDPTTSPTTPSSPQKRKMTGASGPPSVKKQRLSAKAEHAAAQEDGKKPKGQPVSARKVDVDTQPQPEEGALVKEILRCVAANQARLELNSHESNRMASVFARAGLKFKTKRIGIAVANEGETEITSKTPLAFFNILGFLSTRKGEIIKPTGNLGQQASFKGAKSTITEGSAKYEFSLDVDPDSPVQVPAMATFLTDLQACVRRLIGDLIAKAETSDVGRYNLGWLSGAYAKAKAAARQILDSEPEDSLTDDQKATDPGERVESMALDMIVKQHVRLPVFGTGVAGGGSILRMNIPASVFSRDWDYHDRRTALLKRQAAEKNDLDKKDVDGLLALNAKHEQELASFQADRERAYVNQPSLLFPFNGGCDAWMKGYTSPIKTGELVLEDLSSVDPATKLFRRLTLQRVFGSLLQTGCFMNFGLEFDDLNISAPSDKSGGVIRVRLKTKRLGMINSNPAIHQYVQKKQKELWASAKQPKNPTPLSLAVSSFDKPSVAEYAKMPALERLDPEMNQYLAVADTTVTDFVDEMDTSQQMAQKKRDLQLAKTKKQADKAA